MLLVMELVKMHEAVDEYEKRILRRLNCVLELTEIQLNIELEKGYQEMMQGKSKTADLVFAETGQK